MKTNDELRQEPMLAINVIGADGGHGTLCLEGVEMSVIWSFGYGWEHVSVAPFKRHKVPTWSMMCRVKDIFFGADEWVVEYHPAKSEYVDNVKNCLHLWRPNNVEMPVPPSWMVGINTVEIEKSGEK